MSEITETPICAACNFAVNKNETTFHGGRRYHTDCAIAVIDRQKTEVQQHTPEPKEFLMQFFAFSHLPPSLQEISRPFSELAENLLDVCPRNPERTVALRKLLEAKDCAVRAFIAK